jgi:hypothetical protein
MNQYQVTIDVKEAQEEIQDVEITERFAEETERASDGWLSTSFATGVDAGCSPEGAVAPKGDCNIEVADSFSPLCSSAGLNVSTSIKVAYANTKDVIPINP